MKTDAKTNTEESAEEIRPTEAAADAAETTTANAPETTAAEVPTDANGDPIMWDEEHPDRLDFRYYPGVKSLYRKLGALLVAATILPALFAVFVFGLKFALELVILALLPTWTLICSCMKAVRNGSCDAIFLTRFTCFWLALPAFPVLTGFLLFFNNDSPTPLVLIYAGLYVAVIYLATSSILLTHNDRDVRAAFPLDSRSQSASARLTLFFTTVLPLLLMMSCIIIY